MCRIRLLLPTLLFASTLGAQVVAQQQRSTEYFRATHPFGLQPGMTEVEVRRIARLEPTTLPGIFVTEALPEGWPLEAAAYILEFSPRRGLCKLVASTAATGDETWLRQRFALLQMKLSAIYGDPKDFRGYEPGATLTGPKDWMKALAKREAVHSSAWLREHGATLPPGIDGIIMDVQGQQENKLIAVAQFYFGSERLCDEERRAGR